MQGKRVNACFHGANCTIKIAISSHFACHRTHVFIGFLLFVFTSMKVSQSFYICTCVCVIYIFITRRLLHGRALFKKVPSRKALRRRALLGHEHLGKELRKELLRKELLL